MENLLCMFLDIIAKIFEKQRGSQYEINLRKIRPVN